MKVWVVTKENPWEAESGIHAIFDTEHKAIDSLAGFEVIGRDSKTFAPYAFKETAGPVGYTRYWMYYIEMFEVQ